MALATAYRLASIIGPGAGRLKEMLAKAADNASELRQVVLLFRFA